MAKIGQGETMTIRIIEEPMVALLAEPAINWQGMRKVTEWLREYRPECLPEDSTRPEALFPHDLNEDGPQGVRRLLTGNELLVEFSGRKCYNSFGLKAGRKTNSEYVANLFGSPGKIPHASVLYHAKMTFFFGGIGRRVSHELIRHYVGADRDEEGSPSQESTRYTHHPGFFTLHPRAVGCPARTAHFVKAMEKAYAEYQNYLDFEYNTYADENDGDEPKGMDRKRIYEAAAQYLPGAASTSFTWTTNPLALSKLFKERCDFAADLEIQRFAQKLRSFCYKRWPNLFAESNKHVEWATLPKGV